MDYAFSLVRNDRRLFPELRNGDVVVFGDHQRAFARCDCDGNMSRIYPGNKRNTDIWLPLGKDRDSVFAWHGERKKEGFTEMVRVNWNKALKRKEKDERYKERKARNA